MHKKTTKTRGLTEKRPGREARSARTALLQPQSQQRTGVNGKPRGSSSWGQPSASGVERLGSWSADVEEAAGRRVLEQWRAVERTLYDEQPGELQLPAGALRDECLQWRGQLAHLRLVGRAALEGPTETPTRPSSDPTAGSQISNHGLGPDQLAADLQRAGLFSREASFHSFHQPNLKQAKDEALDHIVEFICKELTELEAERLAEERDDLSGSFDGCLTIAPAPTCTGKNPLASSSSFHPERAPEPRDVEPRTRRNKLGTVFNERVIVSPVPFVVTTRESFSTLRKTPILFVAEDAPNNIRSGSRRENTRRKLSLTGKAPLIPAPHVQPSWNTPVCPTIWPKNVKLTPIDTSRLPSCKKRPAKTAESLPPRRNRHSLSPISRSMQPTSSLSYDNHALEVRGSQIVARERVWRPRHSPKPADLHSGLRLPEQPIRN